MALRRPRLP